LLSVYIFCYGPLPAASNQTLTETRKHVMRFHRTNELGRQRYYVASQPRYSGGRPYRSFSRPPVKYPSLRSKPGDFGKARSTPYGRVTTLRYDMDRIPGDRNFIRIRQILQPTRRMTYITPEHLVRDRVEKRPGARISQLLSPLLGGGEVIYDYETPGQRFRAYQKGNPKGLYYDVGRPNPVYPALRDLRGVPSKKLRF